MGLLVSQWSHDRHIWKMSSRWDFNVTKKETLCVHQPHGWTHCTFKITTLWIFWTNDRKIMDTFKMGLHCLQLVTTDYIAGGIFMYL